LVTNRDDFARGAVVFDQWIDPQNRATTAAAAICRW